MLSSLGSDGWNNEFAFDSQGPSLGVLVWMGIKRKTSDSKLLSDILAPVKPVCCVEFYLCKKQRKVRNSESAWDEVNGREKCA